MPKVPPQTEHKKWTGSDMYYKNGLKVKRKARFESTWMDRNRWDRTIWSVPSIKTGIEKVDVEIMSMVQESIEISVPPSAHTGTVVNGDEPWSDGVAKAKHVPSRCPVIPARMISHIQSPVKLLGTQDEEFTLEDIADPRWKKKTRILQSIFPNKSIRHLFNTLASKNGYWDDACDLLGEEPSDEEMPKSPLLSVERSNAKETKKEIEQRN
jgi:hypothetical protein